MPTADRHRRSSGGPEADEVVLREATVADAVGIASVHVLGWQWGYRGQLPAAFLRSLSAERRAITWAEALAAPGDTGVTVAVLGGSIVGFVTTARSRDEDPQDPVGEVGALYVIEDVAGTGVGHRLLAAATARLTALGCRSATLWVLATNDRARRFYERNGWRWDGGEKAERRGDVVLEEVRYALTLR